MSSSSIVLADIEARAQGALRSSPIQALRDLEVTHDADQLLICGRVTSYYHKQLAQEAVLAVAGVVRVINTIDVDD